MEGAVGSEGQMDIVQVKHIFPHYDFLNQSEGNSSLCLEMKSHLIGTGVHYLMLHYYFFCLALSSGI